MRLVLPFRLAPDTLAAPVPGPQHFLMNHPEKREPVQVQRCLLYTSDAADEL